MAPKSFSRFENNQNKIKLTNNISDHRNKGKQSNRLGRSNNEDRHRKRDKHFTQTVKNGRQERNDGLIKSENVKTLTEKEHKPQGNLIKQMFRYMTVRNHLKCNSKSQENACKIDNFSTKSHSSMHRNVTKSNINGDIFSTSISQQTKDKCSQEITLKSDRWIGKEAYNIVTSPLTRTISAGAAGISYIGKNYLNLDSKSNLSIQSVSKSPQNKDQTSQLSQSRHIGREALNVLTAPFKRIFSLGKRTAKSRDTISSSSRTSNELTFSILNSRKNDLKQNETGSQLNLKETSVRQVYSRTYTSSYISQENTKTRPTYPIDPPQYYRRVQSDTKAINHKENKGNFSQYVNKENAKDNPEQDCSSKDIYNKRSCVNSRMISKTSKTLTQRPSPMATQLLEQNPMLRLSSSNEGKNFNIDTKPNPVLRGLTLKVCRRSKENKSRNKEIHFTVDLNHEQGLNNLSGGDIEYKPNTEVQHNSTNDNQYVRLRRTSTKEALVQTNETRIREKPTSTHKSDSGVKPSPFESVVHGKCWGRSQSYIRSRNMELIESDIQANYVYNPKENEKFSEPRIERTQNIPQGQIILTTDPWPNEAIHIRQTQPVKRLQLKKSLTSIYSIPDQPKEVSNIEYRKTKISKDQTQSIGDKSYDCIVNNHFESNIANTHKNSVESDLDESLAFKTKNECVKEIDKFSTSVHVLKNRFEALEHKNNFIWHQNSKMRLRKCESSFENSKYH